MLNIAQVDRIAQREYACPRSEALPPVSLVGNMPGRTPTGTASLARPHGERANLVQVDEDDGLAA